MIQLFFRLPRFLIALLGVTTVGLSTHHAFGASAPLVIVADPWCPYTCEAKGGSPGLLTEALQKMMPEENWKYQAIAWSRAIFQTRKGDYVAILGATEPDGEGLTLVTPALTSRNCFYTKKESKWTYKPKGDSFQGGRLGVITGYTYGEPVDSFVSSFSQKDPHIQSVSGNEPLQQNVQKVMAGRIDFFIEDRNVANYTIPEQDLKKLREAGCLSDTGITIGFSPKHPRGPELAEKWNEKWPEFSQSQTWKDLLKKYKVEISGKRPAK